MMPMVLENAEIDVDAALVHVLGFRFLAHFGRVARRGVFGFQRELSCVVIHPALCDGGLKCEVDAVYL